MSNMPDPIYTKDLLPERFAYPSAFLEWIKTPEASSVYPWTLINTKGEVGHLLYSLRKSDGRNLVPFASLETGDGDVACFDGGNQSGDPAVLMLVLDGSGRSYSYPNFSAWLKTAREESKKW